MEREVKQEILTVLQDIQTPLRRGNSAILNMLSNATLKRASVYQDEDSTSLAVIIYSLSKICNRPRLNLDPRFLKMKDKVAKELKNAQVALQKNDIKNYKRCVRKVFGLIGFFEKKLGMYIVEVLDQAKIKKGGSLYSQGVSAGRAAQLLGVSKWDLMGYLGSTKLAESPSEQLPVLQRLEYAKEVFNV
jgi:hypothetical protein